MKTGRHRNISRLMFFRTIMKPDGIATFLGQLGKIWICTFRKNFSWDL